VVVEVCAGATVDAGCFEAAGFGADFCSVVADGSFSLAPASVDGSLVVAADDTAVEPERLVVFGVVLVCLALRDDAEESEWVLVVFVAPPDSLLDGLAEVESSACAVAMPPDSVIPTPTVTAPRPSHA
jgi:hypothetical protein